MDIESLKLILETVKGVTDNAGSVAVWWIVGHYVMQFITVLATAGTVLGSIYFAVKGLSSVSAWATAGKRVCDAWGGSDYGPMVGSDHAAIHKAIQAARGR